MLLVMIKKVLISTKAITKMIGVRCIKFNLKNRKPHSISQFSQIKLAKIQLTLISSMQNQSSSNNKALKKA